MQRVPVVFALCFFLVPLGCENRVTEPEISQADVGVPIGDVGKKIKEDRIPDEYMVFTRFDAGGTWTLDILLLNLQNPSAWSPVSRNVGVDEGFPSWSPSGDQIVYSAGPYVFDPTLGPVSDPRTWGLHIVDVTGSPPVIGTPANLEVKGHRPDWSPDGNHIAFECYPTPSGPLDPSSKGDICYIERGSAGAWGSPQNLTNTPDANERFPTWSPGSDRLAFERWTQSGGTDVVDLYTVDLTGSETQLTNTPSFHERQPDWSVKDDIAYAEGNDLYWPIVCPPSQMACEPFDTYAGIWTMPVATPVAPKRLTSVVGDLAPHWSTNGNQIVFSGVGRVPPWGGPIWPDVFVIDSQGKNRLNLTGVSYDGEFWGRLRN